MNWGIFREECFNMLAEIWNKLKISCDRRVYSRRNNSSKREDVDIVLGSTFETFSPHKKMQTPVQMQRVRIFRTFGNECIVRNSLPSPNFFFYFRLNSAINVKRIHLSADIPPEKLLYNVTPNVGLGDNCGNINFIRIREQTRSPRPNWTLPLFLRKTRT